MMYKKGIERLTNQASSNNKKPTSIVFNLTPVIKRSLLTLGLLFAQFSHAETFKETLTNFMNEPWRAGITLAFANPELGSLDSSTAWRIFAYHELAYDMGIEASYFSTGDFDFNENVSANSSVQTSAFNIGLRGYGEPSFYDIVFYGKFGISFWNEDIEVGSADSASESGTSPWLGFGGERPINEDISITIETTYHFDLVRDGWLSTIGAGVVFHLN